MTQEYDFISLGIGSAGMAAAIYAKRFNLKTLAIGQESGGLLNEAYKVENYPGFTSISGLDLMMKFREHVKALDIEVVEDSIKGIKKLPDKDGKPFFEVETTSKGSYFSKTILVALGSERRKLKVPGEAKLTGKGVSFCATCDGPFFKDKIVGVVGGSDSAAQAALLLSEYAKKVYIIYRKEKIRAEPIYHSRIENAKNITIINNTNIVEIVGDKMIEKVIFDQEYNGSREFALEGLFVSIGSGPNSEKAAQLGVELDGQRHIKINRLSETNIPGVYAAGDIADGPMKQAITGAAEGVIASQSAFELLK
ncbi:MAG: FAD-dependent oxidoreductase [Nanoarchaeota archaeon]|nr:FAD-dependent oxidoreductase [Nanoarchaeota archaeon]